MIDFQLTDDHEALLQTVREFAQREVAPYIKEWTRSKSSIAKSLTRCPN